MQFVLSLGSYNAIQFLKRKFYKYLSITLPSAAVFNWFRNSILTFTRKLGTQKSKFCLLLALPWGFQYNQVLTAAPHFFPLAKSAIRKTQDPIDTPLSTQIL